MKKLVLLLLVCLFVVFGVLPLYGSSQTTIVLTVGDTSALVNDNAVTLDVAPFIKDGRTFVPLRFVSEQLGGEVTYDTKPDGTVNTITVKMGGAIEPTTQTGVVILSEGPYSEYGYNSITGEVQNQLGNPVTDVTVIATFYDAAGTVVGTKSTSTDPQDPTPSEIASFEISWSEEFPFDHYVLKVTWSEP